MTLDEVIAQERYEDLCEYFGESKDILKNRDDFKAWLDRVKWHIRKVEELYEKYEREPCDDVISRQAAQAKIKSICDKYGLSYEDGERKAATGGSAYALGHAFDDLPPVTPQLDSENNGDLISRQAVLEQIDYWAIGNREYLPANAMHYLTKRMQDIPPVTSQPKMGRWIDDKCSVCGKGIEDLIDSYEWYRNEKPNFCPFCGLKMEVEDNG